jgi:type IV pilus assembly protein PilB
MEIKIPQLLINALVQKGHLTPEDVQVLPSLMQKEAKDAGQILIEKNIISDDDLLALKSELYKLPAIDLDPSDVQKDAVKEISEDIASFYKIVPFAKEGTVLKIGIIDPENIEALEALKFIGADKGLTFEKYLLSYGDFESAVRTYRTLSGEVGKALESISEDTVKEKAEETLKLEEITSESPVTKIVSSLLKHAVESRASDIHIEPFEDRIRTRFRIDGVLQTTITLPKKLHSAIITRIKILSDLKIDETRLAQDGRFSIMLAKRKIDYRVSTFPTKNGEKVVMRILDPLAQRVDLTALGLQGHNMDLLQKAMGAPFGIILITGPTGSGKSTTIAGMLKDMNDEGVNIVTLEDPIEYFLDGISQSQVHEEIGYTFAAGLRHILRQDPDIIMVGEIRDKETAQLAIQAALTGHVVLSTLHTNDSLGVVPRLLDMGIERYLLPSTLRIAAAQRLLRRLCQTCKVASKASTTEEKLITEAIMTMPAEYQKELISKTGYTVYRANTENACKDCGGKAFKGRVGIYEMLEMTSQLEAIILGNVSETAMREEGKRQGMVTMFQDGIIKVLQGTVSFEELLEVAQSGDSA